MELLGQGDEDGGAQERSATLATIEELRRELRAGLRAVAGNLREAGAVTDGYESAYFLNVGDARGHQEKQTAPLFRRVSERIGDELVAKLAAQRFDFDPPDAQRTSWRVLPLGRAMCRKVWELFDEDRDGAWSHEEFVEYMTALELYEAAPYMHVVADNSETWRMFVSDSCEIDANFCMTFAGFVAYREAVEADHPLEKDLRSLNIEIEWPEIALIRKTKALFEEYAVGGDSFSLEISRLPYLLAEIGLLASEKEIVEVIEHQRQFDKCLKHIRSSKKALRLFGYTQQSDLPFNLSAMEGSRVYRASFRRFLFSGWTVTSKTPWRRWLLQTVLGSFGLLRRCQRNVSWAFDWIRKASKTGMLRASQLVNMPELDRGDYVLKLDVGQSFSTRSTIHLTYNADADSAATLHELKYLERGAECFVYVDVACRTGARDAEIQHLAQKLSWLIDHWFQDHIEALPFFFKWFVTIPSKMQLRSGTGGATSSISNSPVIRLVLLFSGGLDLYQVMQSLNLPSSMQFDHLLQRFSFRMLCSHTLEDMLTNKRLDVGTQWSCRSQLDIRLNRRAISEILKQLVEQLDANANQTAEVLDFVAEEKARIKEQETNKAKIQQKGSSSYSASHRGFTTSPPSTTIRKDRSDSTHSLRSALSLIAHLLAFSQETSWTWTFDNLRATVFQNAWVRSALIPQHFEWLARVLTIAGGLATAWMSIGDSFRQEFASTRYAQTSSSGVPSLTRTGSQSALPQSPVDSSKTGLSSSFASSFPFAPTTSAQTGQSQVQEEPRGEKSSEDLENELLELYDLCGRYLVGISVIRAEAGTSGLTCVFEGWNIFSQLPRVAQNQHGRRASLVRTASAASDTIDRLNAVSAGKP